MSDMRLRGPCESEHAQAPLISALVIAYNNSDFIFDTLQSVLTQDYPNIELIVSDDHSTKGFPVDEIIDYINKHRGENIQRVLINENEENMGTVRHVEKLRGMSRGEYELLIAADDVWKDSRVFSDFMDFVSAHEDEHVEWVVSQLEMCDERMHFDRLFVNENTIDLLKRGDMEGLREHIASVAILPSVGCMYKKSFFDKIGSLNAYSLIEDYSAHVRALRMNVRPFYLDRVTAKHRGGGVSHGNRRSGSEKSEVYYKYRRDFMRIFENEIEPHRTFFSEEAYNRARHLYNYNKDICDNILSMHEISKNECDLSEGTTRSILGSGNTKRKIIAAIYRKKNAVIRLTLKQEILASFVRGSCLLLFTLLFKKYSAASPILLYALCLLGILECCVCLIKLLTNIAIKIYRIYLRR
ncbi:glycosyltransferase [Pyramidobacter piscolens]|uniref:glycosyltransferase n=1 Tax=Pyramidobacter piscolens TaxID=638849 RepID=UPI002493434B|nr:glycosyltransferase [Pyramidobacter piscolens]